MRILLRKPIMLNNLIIFKLFVILICFTISQSIYSKDKRQLTENQQYLIKVTFQSPNFLNPWKKKTPDIKIGLGTYIGNNKLLVPSSLLNYSTSIEVQSPENSISKKAKIIKVDLESNLGLLEVTDPDSIFTKAKPTVFSLNIISSTETQVLNHEANGESSIKHGKLGKVSMEIYSDGRIELPVIELSSNEKFYGNGELVFKNDQKSAIGILQSFDISKNQGKVIPGKIILQFINSKNSFPFKGFYFQAINNQVTQTYYGMKKDETGVLVADIILNSTAYDQLKTEDVITKVGSYTIDNQGQFKHPVYGSLPLSYIFSSGDDLGYSYGKKLPIHIIRNKKRQTVNVTLKGFPDSAILIPFGQAFDYKPGYLVLGGFMLTELTEYYLKEWGRNWRTSVDKKMLYRLDFHKFRKTIKDPSRIVFISQVLPDESNNGYHELRQIQVSKINGKPVNNLDQIYQDIGQLKEDAWIVLELEDGIEIPILVKDLNLINARIMKNFQIQNFYSPSVNHSK